MSAMIGLFASKNSTSYSEQLLNAIEKASQYTQNEDLFEVYRESENVLYFIGQGKFLKIFWRTLI